jgi:hypothetical protein
MKDPDSAESKGCTLLREAMGYIGRRSKSAFAEYIGIELQVWSNVEAGHPLSKNVAFLLVAKCPGMTLDWLFLGRTGGLTLHMFKRLEGVDRS